MIFSDVRSIFGSDWRSVAWDGRFGHIKPRHPNAHNCTSYVSSFEWTVVTVSVGICTYLYGRRSQMHIQELWIGLHILTSAIVKRCIAIDRRLVCDWCSHILCIWEKLILCRIAVHICSMLQSCVLGLARSITVSFFIESQITSQDRHSICNVNLFVDLVSMFVIDKSAIDPRLWGDWGTPKCSHWPMAIPCLLPISSRLWLVYISVYIEISISFSVQMTLERTKSLRDCHLWVRDWFAVDRRLYLSQARLFWSTSISPVSQSQSQDNISFCLVYQSRLLDVSQSPVMWQIRFNSGKVQVPPLRNNHAASLEASLLV